MLAVMTRMTLTQVSTWFANARRRLKKENHVHWRDDEDDEDDDESGDRDGDAEEYSDECEEKEIEEQNETVAVGGRTNQHDDQRGKSLVDLIVLHWVNRPAFEYVDLEINVTTS